MVYGRSLAWMLYHYKIIEKKNMMQCTIYRKGDTIELSSVQNVSIVAKTGIYPMRLKSPPL